MAASTTAVISRAMEDYLKAIYQLAAGDSPVTTSRVAAAMSCRPASVTNMVQRLSDLKLVEYQRYKGVRLTAAGIRIALEIIRHHRLLELYLSEVLGYTWDKVHEEAEVLEHVISEEFEEKIDQALGYPRKDPHGDPIPTKKGEIDVERLGKLWDMVAGQETRVRRVSDKDPNVLRYLASIGIFPDVKLNLVRRDPFDGPVYIRVNGIEHGLSEELARQIFVSLP
jgi:DtxR family Mn-dependent transcriptional regulator